MSSSHSTPSKSSKSNTKPFKSTLSSTPLFTPMMQDRQARNKDTYSSSDESNSSLDGPPNFRFDTYGNDSYANIQLRRDAAIKLDSPELVMMLAQHRNDSIPATRLYLTKILCGYITREDIDAEAAAQVESLKVAETSKSRPSKGGRTSTGSAVPVHGY